MVFDIEIILDSQCDRVTERQVQGAGADQRVDPRGVAELHRTAIHTTVPAEFSGRGVENSFTTRQGGKLITVGRLADETLVRSR